MLKHTDLPKLTFAGMPRAGETQGVARNRHLRYRHRRIEALDAEDLPRNYHVQVSSANVVTVQEGLLTDEGRALRLEREKANIPAKAHAFVAEFFADHPCNPYNGVKLAKYLAGMDEKFEGIFTWRQAELLKTHGCQNVGQALDFLKNTYQAKH